MLEFVNGTDDKYDDLEREATGFCRVYRNRMLPPGCRPAMADVAFEVEERSGRAMLLVGKVRPGDGIPPDVAQWLTSGVKVFGSFGQLKAWIRGPLGSAFPQATGQPDADSITDMQAVRSNLPGGDEARYIDETELYLQIVSRVRAQDSAARQVSRSVKRHLAKKDPTRPETLFAIGPTGVGKTEMAMTLPKAIESASPEASFGFVRLDMGEMQEKHQQSELRGAPPGYIGHGSGSRLVDAIRSNPRTIVLFDEIEKAHPSIYYTLMNAIDAGRLSTPDAGGGRRGTGNWEIDCTKAVFFFTSNIESAGILEELSSRGAVDNLQVVDEVCRRRLHASGMPAEIVGRVARFLVFQPLSKEARAEIVVMAIAKSGEQYGLEITYINPSIVLDLIRKCSQGSFGVRPANYFIDELLGDTLAAAAASGLSRIKLMGPTPRFYDAGSTRSSVTDMPTGSIAERRDTQLL